MGNILDMRTIFVGALPHKISFNHFCWYCASPHGTRNPFTDFGAGIMLHTVHQMLQSLLLVIEARDGYAAHPRTMVRSTRLQHN